MQASMHADPEVTKLQAEIESLRSILQNFNVCFRYLCLFDTTTAAISTRTTAITRATGEILVCDVLSYCMTEIDLFAGSNNFNKIFKYKLLLSCM